MPRIAPGYFYIYLYFKIKGIQTTRSDPAHMFLKELLVAKETDALFHNFVDDAIITQFKNITYVNKNCAHVKN